MSSENPKAPVVERLSEIAGQVDLWVSCHGYESRSIAHLECRPFLELHAKRRVSCGFDFPDDQVDVEVRKRVAAARARLTNSGFQVPVTDEIEFEELVGRELDACASLRPHVVADISSMSRGRIAALMLQCARRSSGAELDLIYFPSSFRTHKHQYEPLEHFGPFHRQLAGWPEDPDLPLAVVLGLGTEPRRGDGVVEMMEPDILAVFMPYGDETEYEGDIRKENRRLLEVAGEPVNFPVRDPAFAFVALLSTTTQLADRSRVVIVPLGPKIFSAMSVAVALSVGPQVGVWRASAGRGVEPVDVQAAGDPVLAKILFAAR